MRSVLLAAALVVGGLAFCKAQPPNLDVAPRTSTVDPNNTFPEIDEFVPVDREATYDPMELRRKLRYPKAARNMGLEGEVVLRTLVDKNGKVVRMAVERSTNKLLENEAALAVRSTSFTPASIGEAAVASWVDVKVVFRLDETISTAAEPSTAKRFEQEYGTLTFKMTVNDAAGTGTFVWDGYGERTATRFTANNPDDSARNYLSIESDGYRTRYTSTAMGVLGRRTPIDEEGLNNGQAADIQRLPALLLRAPLPPGVLKTLPERTVAGRRVKGIGFDTLGIVTKAWSDKWLVLAAEVVILPEGGDAGLSIVMEATSIDLTAKVPASGFAPPPNASIINEERSKP